MNEGDIVCFDSENEGKFSLLKILKIDPAPEEDPDYGETYHCLCYVEVDQAPKAKDVDKLEVAIWHAPIDGQSVCDEGKLICNQEVKQDELSGYFEFLKHTDFERYANESNQDLDKLISDANQAFQKGNEFASEDKYEEAIKAYTESIEILPFFFEAIDNRGLTYMDLGDFRSAVTDFELSYSVNPDNYLAFFSMGESLFHLKEFEQARDIFSKGAELWPEHQELFLSYVQKIDQE